jgi:hypothetical protein
MLSFLHPVYIVGQKWNYSGSLEIKFPAATRDKCIVYSRSKFLRGVILFAERTVQCQGCLSTSRYRRRRTGCLQAEKISSVLYHVPICWMNILCWLNHVCFVMCFKSATPATYSVSIEHACWRQTRNIQCYERLQAEFFVKINCCELTNVLTYTYEWERSREKVQQF